MQRGPQPGLELAQKVCDLSGLVNGESAPALGGGEGSESGTQLEGHPEGLGRKEWDSILWISVHFREVLGKMYLFV